MKCRRRRSCVLIWHTQHFQQLLTLSLFNIKGESYIMYLDIQYAYRHTHKLKHTQKKMWGDNFMAVLWDSSPIRLNFAAICLQHRCHSRAWMDICHAAGPVSPITSVALQGLCIQTLYMPSNTDLSPLSDLQAWPLSKANPRSDVSLLWSPLVKGSVTQSVSGYENIVFGEKARSCQSLTMDGTDAGFMAPKHDHWWMTLAAVTHGTWLVMLMCSKNILRAIWLGFHRQTWNYSQCSLSLNGVEW